MVVLGLKRPCNFQSWCSWELYNHHYVHESRLVCYIMSDIWPSSPLPWPVVSQLPANCQIHEWGFWPLAEGECMSQSSQNQQKNCPTEHSQIANPQNWPNGWMVVVKDSFISSFFFYFQHKELERLFSCYWIINPLCYIFFFLCLLLFSLDQWDKIL